MSLRLLCVTILILIWKAPGSLASIKTSEIQDEQTYTSAYYDRVNMGFNLRPADHDSYDLHYETRSPFAVGAAFHYKGYTVSAATNIAMPSTETEKRTEARSFQIFHQMKSVFLDAYWYQFRGFNRHTPGEFADDSGETALSYHEGLRAQQYGANALYLFRPDRLWLPEQAKYSHTTQGFGWSWLLDAKFSGLSVKSKESLIPTESAVQFGKEKDMRGIDLNGLFAGGGAGASWNDDAFTIGASVMVLPGYGAVYYQGSGDQEKHAQIMLNLRWGACYRIERFELGISGINDFEAWGTNQTYVQLDRDFIRTYVNVLF